MLCRRVRHEQEEVSNRVVEENVSHVAHPGGSSRGNVLPEILACCFCGASLTGEYRGSPHDENPYMQQPERRGHFHAQHRTYVDVQAQYEPNQAERGKEPDKGYGPRWNQA